MKTMYKTIFVMRFVTALLIAFVSYLIVGAKGIASASEPPVRRNVSFNSEGIILRGWLYLPASLKRGDRAPAIVAANAFTSIKEITLPGYAERFANSGFVTLVFDYRNWGESDGEPRNHYDAFDQVQDVRNAITWLSLQSEVDPKRIGGWGISQGGAFMLHLAAFERRLKAVVATATGVGTDFRSIEDPQTIRNMQNVWAQFNLDRVERYKTDSQATYKQAWGKPGEDVLYPVEEAYNFYTEAKRTYAPAWENRTTVQSKENLFIYQVPIALNMASPTPVLIIHAERDVIPILLVRRVFETAREPKKLVVLDCLHTDLYNREPWFTMSSDEAIAWFKKYL